MQDLWADRLEDEDPYYSPHLSLTLYDLSLRPISNDENLRRRVLAPRWTETSTPDEESDT